eukprot:RCo029727
MHFASSIFVISAQSAQIPDPKAVKPNDWLDDEPPLIPDYFATKPEDWNDEEDGTWQHPLIPNPRCQSRGCGNWNPPLVPNPKFRGKWIPPQIANPAFRGKWKARQIPNPHYFEDRTPAHLPKMRALAVEIMTQQGGILFDNFLVTSNETLARDFARTTWWPKYQRELVLEPLTKEEEAAEFSWFSLLTTAISKLAANPTWVLWGVLALPVVLFFFLGIGSVDSDQRRAFAEGAPGRCVDVSPPSGRPLGGPGGNEVHCEPEPRATQPDIAGCNDPGADTEGSSHLTEHGGGELRRRNVPVARKRSPRREE